MTEKSTTQNTLKSSSHWVKQLYYYAVLGISILFIAIGLFTVVRASLVRYVFTSIDDNQYGYSQCDYNNKVVSSGNGPSLNSDEDKKKCKEDAARVNFQNNMLNGTLILIVSSSVLALHTRFVKIRD
jgi:hypothetical protein